MNFFASLKKSVVALLRGPTDPSRIPWHPDLVRKMGTLCQLLSKQPKRNKEANQLLAELLKPLQALCWDYPDHRAELTTRQHMLQLCDVMVVALEAVAPAERFNYYKGVGYLLRRLEHGGSLLSVGGAATSGSDDEASFGEEVALGLQYRALLFTVLRQTSQMLAPEGGSSAAAAVAAAAAAPPPEPSAAAADPEVAAVLALSFQTPAVVQAYCAQVLAVLVVRLPGLTSLLVGPAGVLRVDPSDLERLASETGAVLAQLEVESPSPHPPPPGPERLSQLASAGGTPHMGIVRGNVAGSSAANFVLSSPYLQTFGDADGPFQAPSAALAARCPGLFGWPAFHARLTPHDTTGLTLEGVLAGGAWLRHALHRRSGVFHLFLKYWLEHCQLVEDAQHVVPRLDLRDVVPYRALVRSFLVAYLEDHENRSRSLSDCASALLGVDSGFLNFFLKSLFLSTDAADTVAVLEALGFLETFLRQLQADSAVVPPDFDYEFLCLGLDRVLALEHHVVTARLLALLFNTAPVLAGDGRLRLFGTLLLGKYGPTLFLSWDANVRSVFQQLLIFRMLRLPRRVLQSQPVANSKVFEQDRLLLTRQEGLLRGIRTQVEEEDASKKRFFDPHLEAYAARALEEWQVWMGQYNACASAEEIASHKLAMIQKAVFKP